MNKKVKKDRASLDQALKAFIKEELTDPTQQQPLQAPSGQASVLPQNISLDQKVDRFLIQYERESTPLGKEFGGTVNQTLPVSENKKKNVSLTSLLFEADNDPLGDDDAGVGSGDDPAGGDGGFGDLGGDTDDAATEDDSSETADENELASDGAPQLSLNAFAERVARLVNNYEMLLDPQTTILNRVQSYISKNYSPVLAKELMAQLDFQFGLTPRTENQKVSDFGEVPIASGAAADASGGGGGA